MMIRMRPYGSWRYYRMASCWRYQRFAPVSGQYTRQPARRFADSPERMSHDGRLKPRSLPLPLLLPQFEAQWRPMPDRVQTVIEAKGCYTRYQFIY